MNHDDASPLLADLAASVLQPDVEAEVERHLDNCPNCRRLLAEHYALDAWDTYRSPPRLTLRAPLVSTATWAAAASMLAVAAVSLLWIRSAHKHDMVSMGVQGSELAPEPMSLLLFSATTDGTFILGTDILPSGARLQASSPGGDLWVRAEAGVCAMVQQGDHWSWTPPEDFSGVIHVVAVRQGTPGFDVSWLAADDWDAVLGARGVAHVERRITVE